MYSQTRPPVWNQMECGSGARWTEVNPNNSSGRICEFSGCDCGTEVKLAGQTTDRTTAGEWFRRPQWKDTP